jgi:uncharacterized RDD family membrane protein YckC
MEKRKITDIYETKVFTRKERNEFGQWETVQRVMRQRRPMPAMSSGLRLVHLMIDFYLVQALIIALVLINSSWINVLIMKFLIAFLLIGYYVFSETYFQKTIGKYFTKSVVVDVYGDKPDFRTVVVRTFIRLIVPFDMISFLDGQRGWHDKWSDTFVITEKDLARLKELMLDPKNTDPTLYEEPNVQELI